MASMHEEIRHNEADESHGEISARDEGRQAFVAGVPRNKNPYKVAGKEELAMFWDDGWELAEMETQQDTAWDNE